MVAYSFKAAFGPPIVARTKRQTIRGHRRRHAQLGERLQLYTDMRTKSCQRIIPDPICTKLEEVRFDFRALDCRRLDKARDNTSAADLLDVVTIEINGIPLDPTQRQTLACKDGFDGLWVFPGTGGPMEPWVALGWFWAVMHGPVLFEGVAVHWEDGA